MHTSNYTAGSYISICSDVHKMHNESDKQKRCIVGEKSVKTKCKKNAVFSHVKSVHSICLYDFGH